MTHLIRNFDTLATTPERRAILEIAEAGYRSIQADTVLSETLQLNDTVLTVHGHVYDLAKYKRVLVVGFGKMSCAATAAVERVLRGKISAGVVIDVQSAVCEIADVYTGTHPHPSPENVAFTEKLLNLTKDVTKEDLVIVLVSGGGSSLLCYPLTECDQGALLYEDLKKSGATIEEMNLVRKHISLVKGGGLAQYLYPATVLGLIFCDIPGEHYEEVASGPTYFDQSTVHDAQTILDRYHLEGYVLNETPKDRHLFEVITNIPIVSSQHALDAMRGTAEQLGYSFVDIGTSYFDEAASFANLLLAKRAPKTVVVAAGEPSLKVTKSGGKGGRCQYVALSALEHVPSGDVFMACASDGIDNSDSAGALADAQVLARAREQGISISEALDSFDTYSFFEKTGDLLMTGPLESNVSDFFILISQ